MTDPPVNWSSPGRGDTSGDTISTPVVGSMSNAPPERVSRFPVKLNVVPLAESSGMPAVEDPSSATWPRLIVAWSATEISEAPDVVTLPPVS